MFLDIPATIISHAATFVSAPHGVHVLSNSYARINAAYAPSRSRREMMMKLKSVRVYACPVSRMNAKK